MAYGSPLKLVSELVAQAVREQPDVRSDPPPLVVLDDFGESAVVFDAYFWSDVGGERELRQIRSDVRFRIDELFSENEIVIAFPQQDVHVSNATPLEIRLLKSSPVEVDTGA